VITLYPGGRITSCDELPPYLSVYATSSDDEGALEKSMKLKENGILLAESVEQVLEKCTVCEYRHICRGGCIAAQLRLKSVGKEQEYCQYRISVIEHLRSVVASKTVLFNTKHKE
jgi:uncharacterized protein